MEIYISLEKVYKSLSASEQRSQMSGGCFHFHYIPVGMSIVGFQESMAVVCVSVSVPLLCVSTWASACLPSIQLGEGGVVVVGLSIFHVLLARLFPPNNSPRGEKRKEQKKSTSLMLCFFTSAVSRFEAVFISFFFSLGLSLSLVRLSYSRVVFLESKDRFVLCCLICVSGKKCTGEMECEVRRGREGKRKRER